MFRRVLPILGNRRSIGDVMDIKLNEMKHLIVKIVLWIMLTAGVQAIAIYAFPLNRVQVMTTMFLS
jgi:DUF2075 family protein